MSTELFTTPEGFTLHRPLLFPEATLFSELLTVDRAWDFETMNHRHGKPQPDTPANITRPGFTREVSRFCSVQGLPLPHLMVTPTDQVLEAIFPTEESCWFARFDRFAFYGTISFKAIYHARTNRVLVVADASLILASAYLGYVQPHIQIGATP